MTEFASAFVSISANVAREKIDSGEKFVLFIGRPSCPYCQKFEPKLTEVVNRTKEVVYYLNSEDNSQLDEIQSLRKRYGVATVPGLFVSENGAAKVVCDSSLSVEDIEDFIA